MICLVDNYDSFTYNLAQYLGAFTQVEVVRNDAEELYDRLGQADGIVLSPGPGWPADAGRLEEVIRDFAGKKPILGVCLGHQAIAETFGGKLGLAQQVMHGKQSQMTQEVDSPIFKGLPQVLTIMRYHSIVVDEMPEGFEVVTRTSDDQEIMAIQNKRLQIYGLQYHPESIGTPEGLDMIRNFVALVPKKEIG